MNKLRTVLARIDTGHLSKLWIFYRDYFKSDEACLDFIFDVVHNEPLSTTWQQDVDESLFIPRRMMNCVERMVSTASDMELIRKGKEILLVHARNFKGTFNSLVAGFLETGETLEECVAREVKEETGLDVKNITYFANQPWPYPSGLMVGFIADYAGGELTLQDEELSSGAFYTRDNLPELPRKLSLARKMIDWWIENGK